MLKKQIKTIIEKELEKLSLTDVPVIVDYPADPKHGDYTSNVALVAAKKIGKNPREVAEDVRFKIQDLGMFEKIDVAGPGFLNFWIKNDVIVSSKTYIDSIQGSLKGKRIVVEYTDPNPFKEFHIGHLYSNIVGESITRLLQAAGATVWRADYFGDVGMHVASSIWGLLKKFSEEGESMEKLGKRNLEERIAYFGQAYALGATAYKEDPASAQQIKELNFLIFKAAQEIILPTFHKKAEVDYDQFIKPGSYNYEEIRDLYKVGRAWSLEYFELIYARLGTKFDGYYPESMTGEYGYGMVLDGLKKGVFEKGEGGAIIFPGSKYGLHDRVFINSLGLPTYETKDFGNAIAKQKDFDYDVSLIVTGNEINDYFNVVIKALVMLHPEVGEKTTHFGHGMVRLPEGKMSSRTGKIIRGEWLLNEAKEFAKKLSDSDEVAEQVGVGAVRYALLKNGIGKNVAFNFEESISFDGNSGPYLQYVYVRAQSVLEKAGRKNEERSIENKELHIEGEERELLRLLVRFPEVIEEAAVRYAPHLLCAYLFELAQAFNSFYQKSPILKAKDETKVFRLSLTEKTGQVLKEGLTLLGIKVPDKM